MTVGDDVIAPMGSTPRLRLPSARLVAAIVGVLILVLLAALAWRLTLGPVPTSVFTPAVERILALQTPGGRARIRHADIVWSARAKTLGLALQDVSLRDRRGRPVLAARRLEFGWAADSVLTLRPALGRVSADDFYAVVSVSPQGRYGLGYLVSGPPRRSSDLAGVFGDLTGRHRLGHPLSYLREVELGAGVVDLREIGAPLAWRGHVQRVHFRKAGGRLEATADLSIGDGPAPAMLKAKAEGAVGLGRAFADSWIANLNPSRVFPSVGPTRGLSALDAPVAGQATIGYGARTGIKAADIHLTAGAGLARFGRSFEPFQAAEFRAVFDPVSRDVVVRRFSLMSARADFDLIGAAQLAPETASGPARLDFRLGGVSGALKLSGGGEKQPLKDFAVQARLIPSKARLEIASANVVLGDALLDGHGVLVHGGPGKSPAIDLTGRLQGGVPAATVLALWPERLSTDARKWVAEHIRGGRVGQVDYEVRLPPGAIVPHKPLANDAIKVGFTVSGGEVLIRNDMPHLLGTDGRALLRGNEFHMSIDRAQLNGVGLSAGVIDMPRLTGDGRKYTARFRASGPLRGIVEVIDAPGAHVLSGQGMQPSRFSGLAQAEVSISRPLGPGYGDKFDNYDIAYKGVVRDAVVTGVAMGVDLKAPLVAIAGDEDDLTGKGAVTLGPYRGPLDFTARFALGHPAEKKAVLHGVLDMSRVGLGGPAGSTMPFNGRFESRGDDGQGVIDSRGFTGKASWRQGPGGRILVQGRLDAAAWRAIGVPVSRSMSDRTPAKLELQKTATGWNGALSADAYSGAITLTAGAAPRLRYVAELSPAEARQLGLASSAFSRPQPMVIDVSAQSGSGQAFYAVGPMKGQVNWSNEASGRTLYNWHAALSAADLHAMGLPASVEPKAPIPVDLVMTGFNGAWNGTAQATGATLRFTAAAPVGGRRNLNFAGPVDGSTLSLLGLVPPGVVSGPMALSGQIGIDGRGQIPGHIDVDLTRTALIAPATGYRKAAGRALKVAVDFNRNADGSMQASRLRADGPEVSIDATASLRPDAASTVDARVLKVEGVYDGALQLTADGHGRSVSAHGRYFDARTLVHDLSAPGGGGGAGGGQAPPVRLDLALDQVRVSDRATLHDLRATGVWADPAHRRLDVSANTPAGSAVSLHLTPDAGGGLVSGRITNVADAADSFIGVGGFAGGTATVQGRLRPEGADLEVEMRNVRLVHATVMTQILTMGSLRGMADTMNGEGIAFARVVAPMKLRGSQLYIDDARATGGALGLTAKGVIDIDRRTMDLKGVIAPAYGLNSMVGAVPLLGNLLVSKKGEGVFGITYSARGAFAQPKVSVNPLSLAAPGILRRMFEGRPAAERGEPPATLAAPVAASR